MKDCDYFGYYPDVYSEANNKKLMKPPTTFYISFFNVCAVRNKDGGIGNSLGCEEILKLLIDNGHTIICAEINHFVDEWFYNKGIDISFMRFDSYDLSFPNNVIIMPTALGVPLTYNENVSPFPYICWYKVEEYLRINGYI